jgi:hypothetical protein
VRLDEKRILNKRILMNLTLGVRTLMNQIDGLAKAMGFAKARVQVNVNRQSELVIALLIPPRTPDEWGPPLGFDHREAARRARLERG